MPINSWCNSIVWDLLVANSQRRNVYLSITIPGSPLSSTQSGSRAKTAIYLPRNLGWRSALEWGANQGYRVHERLNHKYAHLEGCVMLKTFCIVEDIAKGPNHRVRNYSVSEELEAQVNDGRLGRVRTACNIESITCLIADGWVRLLVERDALHLLRLLI